MSGIEPNVITLGLGEAVVGQTVSYEGMPALVFNRVDHSAGTDAPPDESLLMAPGAVVLRFAGMQAVLDHLDRIRKLMDDVRSHILSEDPVTSSSVRNPAVVLCEAIHAETSELLAIVRTEGGSIEALPLGAIDPLLPHVPVDVRPVRPTHLQHEGGACSVAWEQVYDIGSGGYLVVYRKAGSPLFWARSTTIFHGELPDGRRRFAPIEG